MVLSCTGAGGNRGGRTHLHVPMASATPTAVAAVSTAALASFSDVLAHAIPTEYRRFSDDLASGGR